MGTKVAFKEVRVFHYSKDHKGQVWAKYSMSPVEPWIKFSIFKRGRSSSMLTRQANTKQLPIKKDKATDLKRVAETYVPEEFRGFYTNLTVTSRSYDSECEED